MTTEAERHETGCCPRLDPAGWDRREFTWQARPFVRDRVRSVLHVPINFGAVMRRVVGAIESAGAEDSERIVLCDENSLWGADVYVSTSREVPGARNETISGRFFARVYEGPYSQVQRWVKDMRQTLSERGMDASRLLFWYTTCPRCAKAYGKNHVVLLAETSGVSQAD